MCLLHQVRQLACVMLRRHIPTLWPRINAQVQAIFEKPILQISVMYWHVPQYQTAWKDNTSVTLLQGPVSLPSVAALIFAPASGNISDLSCTFLPLLLTGRTR